MKNLRTAITAINHMITHIPYTGSCCSWHNIGILGHELKICKKKVECPLFSPLRYCRRVYRTFKFNLLLPKLLFETVLRYERPAESVKNPS